MALRDCLHNSVIACHPRVSQRPAWDFCMNMNEGLMFSLPVLDNRACIGGKCSPEIIISATPLHINRHKRWDSPTITLSHNSSDWSSLCKQQVPQRWAPFFFFSFLAVFITFKTCRDRLSEVLCLKTWNLTNKQLFCGAGKGNRQSVAFGKKRLENMRILRTKTNAVFMCFSWDVPNEFENHNYDIMCAQVIMVRKKRTNFICHSPDKHRKLFSTRPTKYQRKCIRCVFNALAVYFIILVLQPRIMGMYNKIHKNVQ